MLSLTAVSNLELYVVGYSSTPELSEAERNKIPKKRLPSFFLKLYTYVFWRANYENDSESWRKFDFYGENYKKLIKIIVFYVYLGKLKTLKNVLNKSYKSHQNIYFMSYAFLSYDW